MTGNWYFTRNRKDRLGPFSGKQLVQLAQSGLLLPGDMVRKEGETQWVPASSISELFVQPIIQPTECYTSVPAKESMPLWQTAVIPGSLVLLALFVSLVIFVLPSGRSNAEIGCFLLGISVIGGIVGLVFLVRGIITSCPECKKWWARVYLGSKVIGEKKCYGLVTRRGYTSSTGYIAKTRDHPGGTVHNSGTTSWQERVPVVRTTYRLLYECKYCQARWSTTEVEEVEDFERE